MKKIVIAVIAVLLAVPSFSQVYVSGKLVGAQQRLDAIFTDGADDYHITANETSFGAKVAVGTEVMKNIRAELEYGYAAFKPTGEYNGEAIESFVGRTSMNTLMLNAYYDLKNSSRFTPYIGLGLGLANINIGKALTLGKSVNNTVFAWNAGVGVGYGITDNITLDIGVKYNDFGDTKDNGGFGTYQKNTYSNVEMLVGVRYKF